MQIADCNFRLQLDLNPICNLRSICNQICNLQSAICNLKSAISSAIDRVVRIRLRVWMTRRRITAATWMRLAGAGR
jgi:hypothetical protein